MSTYVPFNFNQIKKAFKDNYQNISFEFNKSQGIFLNDIYKRYNNDLDSAVIILYFAKNLHRNILRKREKDLSVGISFNEFWNNHNVISTDKHKVIEISKSTGLPKETIRRKIKKLIKMKMLEERKNITYWTPIEKDKASYNLIIDKHLNVLINLIKTVSIHLNIKLDEAVVKKEILENFSFYWLRYLETQLEHLKTWQVKVKDLELLMIYTEFEIQKKIFKNNKITSHISTTNIANVIGLPRSTTIRKVSKLLQMKILDDKFLSKRFVKNKSNFFFKNLIKYTNVKNISDSSINTFSEFYLTVIKSLMRKY